MTWTKSDILTKDIKNNVAHCGYGYPKVMHKMSSKLMCDM